MVEFNRDNFIRAGIERGKNAEEISTALATYGQTPLSNNEERLIATGRWGTNIGQRVLQDVKDIGVGLASIIPAGVAYATDKQFRDKANKYLPKLLNPVNIGKAVTENYNITPGLASIDMGEQLKDIVAGINANPGLAALDILPVLGPAIKGAKSLGKLGKSSGNIPETIKTITGKNISRTEAVNDILKTSKTTPVKYLEELETDYAKLTSKYGTEDIATAYKNLSEGTRVGSKSALEATNEIYEFANKVNKSLNKLGISPEKSKEVTTLEQASRAIKNDTGLDIPLDDLRKTLSSKEGLPKLNDIGLDKQTVNTYMKDAQRLYDEGLITPLRYGSRDVFNEGLVTPEDLAKGALAERRYGTQSYDKLAEAFKEGTYNDLFKEMSSAETAKNSVNEFINTIGVPVSKESLPTLTKDETLLSKGFINDTISSSLESGKSTNKTLKKVLDTIKNNPEAVKAYDDLYIVNKKDVGALRNAIAPDRITTGWINNLSNIGKQQALSSFNYLAGNEFANISSNAIAGVMPKHYVKALNNMEDVPEALKRASSYQGYLGKEAAGVKSLQDTYRVLFKNILKSDTTPSEKFKIVQTMANLPIFKAASAYETIDRSANYFKNAERLAKELNKPVEKVIQDAKVNGGNNPTFREIRRRIDNELGDYVGSNYYLPSRLDDVARAIVPFSKVYTQGGRVLYNAARRYPLGYQTQVKYPSLLGNKLTAYGASQGVTPDEEYGGFPYQAGWGRYPSKVLYSPYHNVTAVGEIAGGLLTGNPDLLPMVNTFGLVPLLSLMGKNKYGKEATLPNEITVNGVSRILDNNGNVQSKEPTISDRIKLVAAQMGQAYLPGVSTMNSSILPLLSYATGLDYRSPSDYSILGQVGEFKLPLLSEGRNNTRDTKEEKLFPLLGIRTKEVYRKRLDRISPRDMRNLRRKQFIQEVRNRR